MRSPLPRAGCFYRVGLFRSHSPGCPVVVVGNITVGGTGKTPLTLWLAEALTRRGLRVGIVLRGYGRTGTGIERVRATSDAAQVGDEALLIAQRSGLPVAVGADRVAAARLLVSEGANLILADDGLQHLALARQTEIAVIDARRGFGNGLLPPAGPLRDDPQDSTVLARWSRWRGSGHTARRAAACSCAERSCARWMAADVAKP